MMWNGWGGGGWGGGYGMAWFGFMHLLWWLLLIGGGVALVRWAVRPGSGGRDEDRSRAILRERYARGEIDKTEFEERMKILKQ